MIDQIRAILREHAHLPVSIDTLSDEQNLYDAGMSSHATVNVMLALEDEFDIEFPVRLLHRSVFSSVSSIRDALHELCNSPTIAGVAATPPLDSRDILQSDCSLDESIRPETSGSNPS